MTVIVYSNKQLAFDKRITQDTALSGKATKGVLLFYGACAGCGEMQTIQAFLDWCSAGAEQSTKEKFGLHETAESFQGIIINSKDYRALPKGVYLVDDKFYPYPLKAKHYTLGSGAHFALGALHMGATAEEAAKIAVKCDVACGNGIEVIDV